MIQDPKTGSGGERKRGMTWKTNFDRYLEQHLSDSEFAERFREAGEAWDKVTRQTDAPKPRRCARDPDQESRT